MTTLERWRVRTGQWKSDDTNGWNGHFLMPFNGEIWLVRISDGMGWRHLRLAALLTIAGLLAEQRHGGGIAQDAAQDRERKLAQPTPTPQSTVVPNHTPDLVRNWQEWVFALGATHADTPEHAKRLGEHFRVRPASP